MFLAHVFQEILDLSKDMRVLDLSAAPGGKSTLIQSMISQNSLLVANEIISSRNNTLRQNLTRWGGDNHIVTQSDPRFFSKLPEYFDVILVDAPCSGEGLIRKDPSAASQWAEDKVEMCASRQRRILADIVPALAPGGVLIYSTCTYSEAENEENMRWLLLESQLELIDLPVPDSWGVCMQENNSPGYRFYPHCLSGEGFFIATFKKSGAASDRYEQRRGALRQIHFNNATVNDTAWLTTPARYKFFMRDEQRIAIPSSLTDQLQDIADTLRITAAGLNMGKVYHKVLKPSPELALSQHISSSIPRIDLDMESALDFLAHITLAIDPNIEPGRYLVCHGGYGLGWLHKLKTGQIRNNYPSAWRILKR